MFYITETSLIPINEELDENEYKPVFVILSTGKSIISGAIRYFTDSEFSHASFSFDPYLREIWSYNFKKFKMGLTRENLFILGNRHIMVYCLFIKKNQYKRIRKELRDYQNHKTHYAFLQLFGKAFHDPRASKNKYTQVCSSFVYALFKSAGINITKEELRVASPAELADNFAKNNTAYPVYNGYTMNFDAVKIKSRVARLYKKLDTTSFASYREGVSLDDLVSNAKYRMRIQNYKNQYKEYLKKCENINTDKIMTEKEFIERKMNLENAKNDIKDQIKQSVLNESLQPDEVDRSNYKYFNLFGLFNIYTTLPDLEFDSEFVSKMRWVKTRLEEIANEAHFKLIPFEITLCGSFEELDRFYDHKAPKWVTGFTWGNKIYMKAPNIYNGKLYYNIVLHESIHAMLWNNLGYRGLSWTVPREEGFAVFFSTPLKDWLKELNHNGSNWFYYENAIDIQEDYINGGMDLVIRKSKLKRER